MPTVNNVDLFVAEMVDASARCGATGYFAHAGRVCPLEGLLPGFCAFSWKA